MRLTAINNCIKTGLAYGTWALITPLFYCVMLPIVLLPKKLRVQSRLFYACAYAMSYSIIKSSSLRLVIRGKENLPTYPNTPAIIIMNHASSLDIPLGQILVGCYPYAWIGHERYGKVPILGILFRRMHISLKKMSGSDGRIALLALYNAIKNQQRHALIFPEGTRYSDGNIHEFYNGFAMLSQKLERPVIPVYIQSMHTIYPKHSFVIDSSNNTVTIIVGEPMYSTKEQTPQEFAQNVHSWFVKQTQK